jgi:hypothetical protein
MMSSISADSGIREITLIASCFKLSMVFVSSLFHPSITSFQGIAKSASSYADFSIIPQGARHTRRRFVRLTHSAVVAIGYYGEVGKAQRAQREHSDADERS